MEGLTITHQGVFSDDTVITWRISQPVHTIRLYEDSNDCQGKPMNQYYANVIIFHEPVIMSIPAARYDTEYTHSPNMQVWRVRTKDNRARYCCGGSKQYI